MLTGFRFRWHARAQSRVKSDGTRSPSRARRARNTALRVDANDRVGGHRRLVFRARQSLSTDRSVVRRRAPVVSLGRADHGIVGAHAQVSGVRAAGPAAAASDLTAGEGCVACGRAATPWRGQRRQRPLPGGAAPSHGALRLTRSRSLRGGCGSGCAAAGRGRASGECRG